MSIWKEVEADLKEREDRIGKLLLRFNVEASDENKEEFEFALFDLGLLIQTKESSDKYYTSMNKIMDSFNDLFKG